MKKKLKSTNQERILIKLPIKRFSILSHLENIMYCIDQINKYSRNYDNPVVGYFIERSLGVRETLHRVLPIEKAEELKIKYKRFDYVSLKELLDTKKEISGGKYKTYKGLITGLNPAYPNS